MILLTGAAGFIGFHVALALLAQGRRVIGVDNLNTYYDPRLKHRRLAILAQQPGFSFAEADIADPAALRAAAPAEAVEYIIHLAAQAGVRWSLDHPFEYERSNLAGHLSVLEFARAAPRLRHLIYASSSSVYGDRPGPFREEDRCDAPASLYAATKRSCELMSETYTRLFGIPQTGLRFFSVYGPWGRPDMAYWIFTERLLEGLPIQVFGGGRLARDYTHISDVAPMITTMLDQPPEGPSRHEIYNLGNSSPAPVDTLLSILERATGCTAERDYAPAPPGDVTLTYADISKANARFGYAPRMSLEAGLADFADWYRTVWRDG